MITNCICSRKTTGTPCPICEHFAKDNARLKRHEYYMVNREKFLQDSREYRIKHPGQSAKIAKKYYQKNKKIIRAKALKYYHIHKEKNKIKRQEYYCKYYQKNKEKLLLYAKNRYQKKKQQKEQS